MLHLQNAIKSRKLGATRVARQRVARQRVPAIVCNCFLSIFCASFFPFFFPPSPTVPTLLYSPPSSDLKTPPFPRGNAIFRGWGCGEGFGGDRPAEKKKGISLKTHLFSRVLFSFFPPLLATPLPPLLLEPSRPFLPLEKCSVL